MGSEETGDDLVAGEANLAESLTRIWAQEPKGKSFDGVAILVAEGALRIDDEDDYKKPTSSRIHGVFGWGVNDGVGVVGLAGNPVANHMLEDLQMIGVFGKGAPGVVGDGFRAGVEGRGNFGDGSPSGWEPHEGPGVVGRGARQPAENNSANRLHAPGVVGIGGGAGLPVTTGVLVDGPADDLLPSVGVVGKGADAETRTVDGVDHGPSRPGAGVIGLGGKSIPHDAPFAPGVIGISGGGYDLPHPPEDDVGVIGFGAWGVYGRGRDGPGVVGTGSVQDIDNSDSKLHDAGVVGLSGFDPPLPAIDVRADTGVCGAGRNGVRGIGADGRGGIFESTHAAQARLIPVRRRRMVDLGSFMPTAVSNPSGQGIDLPRNGRTGDLMTTVDDQGQCLLWFCVREASAAGVARWAQVMLGSPFDGTL